MYGAAAVSGRLSEFFEKGGTSMKKALRVLLYCVLAATLAGCSGGGFGVSPLPYNASGRVVDSADDGVPGVALLFSDGYGTAETGEDGQWLKSHLQGRVTVTPSAEGLVFTPDQGTVSLASTSVTFVAVPAGDNQPPPGFDPFEEGKLADREVSIDEDSNILIDVLSGMEGDGIVIIGVQPLHGTVTITPDQKILYVPDPDFYGEDSFTYTIMNPEGETATGTVTVRVRPMHDAPIASDDYFLVIVSSEGTPLAGLERLLNNDRDPDGDPIEVVSVSQPRYGRLVKWWPEGRFHYLPPVGFEGTDTFEYTIWDGTGLFASAEVTVDVRIE
jgi:hypothetical protein